MKLFRLIRFHVSRPCHQTPEKTKDRLKEEERSRGLKKRPSRHDSPAFLNYIVQYNVKRCQIAKETDLP